jgi:hypothetical protein
MHVTSQYMQYDSAPSTQLPECMHGLTAGDVLPPPSNPSKKQPSSSSSSSAEASSSSRAGDGGGEQEVLRQHYGRVIAALLYVATGGLDQVSSPSSNQLLTAHCSPFNASPTRPPATCARRRTTW